MLTSHGWIFLPAGSSRVSRESESLICLFCISDKRKWLNWKSCAFTIISMNYCSQITLPKKAGAFNDPILKYLTGKPAKHHSYFYFLWLWLWTYKNIYSWGCDKIGFFSLIAVRRTLSKFWRLENKVVFLKGRHF